MWDFYSVLQQKANGKYLVGALEHHRCDFSCFFQEAPKEAPYHFFNACTCSIKVFTTSYILIVIQLSLGYPSPSPTSFDWSELPSHSILRVRQVRLNFSAI